MAISLTPAAADRGLATWPLSRFDLVDTVPLGVDTPEHLERARELLSN